MSRNYLFSCLLMMLLLAPGQGFPQEPLKFGTTKLKTHVLEFKKIKCKLTPKVTFDTNNRNSLNIILTAEWIDKNGSVAKGAGHVLYMVENPSDFIVKNKTNLQIPNPGIESLFRIQKPPKFSENDSKVSYIPFKDGYNGFQSESEPIILLINGAENNIIAASFYFAYIFIEGAKKNLIDADLERSWTFTIPSKPLPGSGCDSKVIAYDNRINSIHKKYLALGIETTLNKTGVQTTELESKSKECAAWLESARKLNDSITNDPGLTSCQDEKNSILNSLKSIAGTARSDEQLIAQKIVESKNKAGTKTGKSGTKTETGAQETGKAKTEPAVASSTGEELNALTARYHGIYKELSSDFAQLNIMINDGRSSIQSRLDNNSKRISAVQVMIENEAQLTPDSKKQLSQELNISKSDNQDSYDANQALLGQVREFKARIEREKSYCESDFLRLDKKTMPAEGKKIEADLDGLFDQASSLELNLDLLGTGIYGQNSDLSRLIIKIQGDEEMSAIMGQFDTSFSDLISKLSLLKIKVKDTRDNFEANKFSKRYYKRSKEKLLSRVDEINSGYSSLMRTYDSLVSIKASSFKKFDFDPLITSQQEFEKAEAGFGSRVDTLRKTINEWPAMAFPYIKVILSIVIICILVFGLFIYYRALRKKKILKTIIKPAGKGAKNIIKIQNSDADKSNRGIGFLSELQASNGNFFELDLSLEWDDTEVTRVYFERSCIIKTYRFFEDSIHSTGGQATANETGGFLIGQWNHDPEKPEKYIVSLEDFIEPGDDASFSKYQLNFGAKIGVKLQSVLDNHRQKTGRDFVLTSWFHSHPGLKIFLSDYDLAVQEDFAGAHNKHKMIALVLDPYTPSWDLGIFSYQQNGKMNNAAESKKFFSFDSMYRWAINPQPQVTPHVEPLSQSAPPPRPIPQTDNYFSYTVTGIFPESPVRKVYFSIPGIIELKRFIEDSKLSQGPDDIFAHLAGDKFTQSPAVTDVIIDNLSLNDREPHKNGKNDKEIVGQIVCLSGQDDAYIEKLQKWMHDKVAFTNPTNIILLVTPDKNSLLVFPNAYYKEIPGSVRESAAHIFITELIDWTRKRK